jgi:hypothetical protein
VANESQVVNEGDDESAANESSAEPLPAPLYVRSDDDDDDDDDDSYTLTDDDDDDDSYDDEKEPRRWCPELETALQHLLNMQDKANKALIKKKLKVSPWLHVPGAPSHCWHDGKLNPRIPRQSQLGTQESLFGSNPYLELTFRRKVGRPPNRKNKNIRRKPDCGNKLCSRWFDCMGGAIHTMCQWSHGNNLDHLTVNQLRQRRRRFDKFMLNNPTLSREQAALQIKFR